MKNCPKCGAMVSDGTTGCPTCAAKDRPQGEPPKNGGFWPWIGAGVKILLGFIFLPQFFILIALLAVTWLHMMSPAGLKTGERDTRFPLGTIRSALSIYYGDTEGQYPNDPSALTGGKKWLNEMPLVWRPIHGDAPGPGRRANVPHTESREVTLYADSISRDTGRWGYVNNPKDKMYGTVFIDCTHTDSTGSVWSSY